MQFIEVKIKNTRFEKMGDGDIARQMKERTAALNQRAEEVMAQERAGIYKYQGDWNPFPAWLQDLIRAMATESRSKARYDDENSIFRIKIDGDRYEYDQFYAKFSKRFSEAVLADPENIKWSAENEVRVTSSADDENAAMNDLELYQRNSAALPPSRAPQPGA